MNQNSKGLVNFHPLRWGTAILVCALCLNLSVAQDKPKPDATEQATQVQPVRPDHLKQAQTAYRKGDVTEALRLLEEAAKTNPKNPEVYYFRAQMHQFRNQPALAVQDYTQVLALDPEATSIYQQRGQEYFKLGKFVESIADFDRFLKKNPNQEPHHWQRGISYYYAREYAKGRAQFELHQKVNSQDVENAVWHFLCVAKQENFASARKLLIPIEGDSRVPMKEVHLLFRGMLPAEEVLARAQKEPEGVGRESALFYAHLYLGLYYEAEGQVDKSRRHIFEADKNWQRFDYMGAVAHVHAEELRKGAKSSKDLKP